MVAQKNTVKKQAAAPKVEVPKGVEQDEVQENTVQENQAPRKRHAGPWVKMDHDLIVRHSLAGNLVGHDPQSGEVILSDPDFELPEEVKEESPQA